MACMEQDHRDKGIEGAVLVTYSAAKVKRIFLGSRHPGTRRLTRRRFGVEGCCSLGLPSTCTGTTCFSYTPVTPVHRKSFDDLLFEKKKTEVKRYRLLAVARLDFQCASVITIFTNHNNSKTKQLQMISFYFKLFVNTSVKSKHSSQIQGSKLLKTRVTRQTYLLSKSTWTKLCFFSKKN